MLDAVEHFATKYQHTAELLTAIGTVGAVIVSLVLASLAARASRTRLKASVSLSFVVYGKRFDPQNVPTFLTISVTNTGNMPLRIPFSFFAWKIPFHRDYFIIQPMDAHEFEPGVPGRRYPVEIAPRASETFRLSDLATFQSETKRLTANISFLRKLRIRFIRAIVSSDDGRLFRVKLNKDIREIWRQA